MRVLVVEDDPKLGPVLVRGLATDAIAADLVTTGREAIVRAGATDYTVIVLDVMLPDLDGFQVCRALREDNTFAPVLMLTARDAIDDRVQGLDSGADDYLVKPFSFVELLARVRAMSRRGPIERTVDARGRRPAPGLRAPPGVARRHADRPLAQGVRDPRGADAPCW